jgi:hypothetical protein
MEFTEVPLDAVHLDHGRGHRRHGVDDPEGAVAVAAGPLEGHAVAPRADGPVGDARGLQPVHGEEGRDAVLVLPLGEQVADAAQVARALLADVADEQDVPLRADLGRVERADVAQQHREGVAVVADAGRMQPGPLAADLHVRALGEDGVQVGGDHHEGAARRAGPAPQPHGVALGVDLHVAQPVGAQHLGVGPGALLLLERRRLDLGDGDGVGDDPVVLCVQGGHRGLEGGRGADRGDTPVGRGGLGLRLRRGDEHERRDEGEREPREG